MCMCVFYVHGYARERGDEPVGSHDYGGWQIPSPPGGSTGRGPRAVLALQFKAEAIFC